MSDAVPKFYRFWLGAEAPAAPETSTLDCVNCEMVRPRGLTRDLGPFHPRLKCCTFQPYLPSFTLGTLIENQLVSDETLDGYLSQCELTPLGAIPKASKTSVCETGKLEAKRCPFLSRDDRAICTIRDYRPSTCAGYVCKSSKGTDGFRAWQEWEDQIAQFESTLAHLTAFDLGYTTTEMTTPFSSLEIAREFFLKAAARSRSISVSE